jgi:signal transduction histidine kinase
VSAADGPQPDPETRALLRRLSHDLRTPLNNIVGTLELIELEAHKPADVVRWVGVARQAADRLRAMLDELTTTTEI